MSDDHKTGGDAAPTTGTATPAPGSDASGSQGQTGSADYESRIRSDPDFALREAKSHQSRADQEAARNRELSRLVGGDGSRARQLLEQYGADTVAAAVENYAQLRNHADLGKAIQEFETTGTLNFQSNSDAGNVLEDEYMTDEERELKALRAEVSELRQGQTSLTVHTGTTALQGHLEKVKEAFHLSPDEFRHVSEALESDARKWAGSPQGVDLLKTIQTADGYATVKALALGKLPDSTFLEMGERKRLRDKQRLSGFETDGPSRPGSPGDEELPTVKGALAAFQQAKENPGAMKRKYG